MDGEYAMFDSIMRLLNLLTLPYINGNITKLNKNFKTIWNGTWDRFIEENDLLSKVKAGKEEFIK